MKLERQDSLGDVRDSLGPMEHRSKRGKHHHAVDVDDHTVDHNRPHHQPLEVCPSCGEHNRLSWHVKWCARCGERRGAVFSKNRRDWKRHGCKFCGEETDSEVFVCMGHNCRFG